ncbi:hypothetical protein B0H16DRAFT_1720756 [Mycena metata]|uniref:F-box domain-containing protein n=1 Tax=Mycena metata TaxID=1033252 RepID=A0AAD7J790_9AGAR|nr:hypothetical protein B0H16DRAFT_1720756 [Mycena metata]
MSATIVSDKTLDVPYSLSLPAELLVEIFDMCSPLGDDGLDGLSDTTTPLEEANRLAKTYLLQLSQVCSHWHVLVMGTPMLWRILIADTTLWHVAPVSAEKLFELVTVSLDRGGSHPLCLEVAVEDQHGYGSRALDLLARHSRRWRQVVVWSGFSIFQSILPARGNLPLLEKLEITQNGDWMDCDVFEIAPRLTTFTITGWVTSVPVLPWGQIQSFNYRNFEANDLAQALAHLRHDFAPQALCDLTLVAWDIRRPIDLPPVISNLSSLALTLAIDETQGNVLGPILGCLTTRFLSSLSLTGRAQEPPLEWCQRSFIALASRSGLYTTLTTLEINRTSIRDDEVIASLSALPALEQLFLADCVTEPPHIVITDHLLRLLTWPADSTAPLVPRLNFLCLTSVLGFTDDVYWNFVDSRLVPAQWSDLLLEAKIYWLPNCTRTLSDQFLERGAQLDAARELNFTARSDIEYEQ